LSMPYATPKIFSGTFPRSKHITTCVLGSVCVCVSLRILKLVYVYHGDM